MLLSEHANITTSLKKAIDELPKDSEVHTLPYMLAIKGMIELVNWLMVDPSKENRQTARVIVRTARKILKDVIQSRTPEDGDFYILDNLDTHTGHILMDLKDRS